MSTGSFGGHHGDDVLLKSGGGSRKGFAIVASADFVVFNHCGIHKCLSICKVAFFEIIDLVTNPLCPDFGLANALVSRL